MQAAKQPRVRSIKSRFRRIVLATTATALAVWLTLSGYLFYNAVEEYQVATVNNETLQPVSDTLTLMMRERSDTVSYLAEPSKDHERALDTTRTKADESMEQTLGKLEQLEPEAGESVRDHIDDLVRDFDTRLPRIRDDVDGDDASRADVLDTYNSLLHTGTDMLDARSRGAPNASTVGPLMSATHTFRSEDLLARADAQLAEAFANDKLTRKDQEEFTRLIGATRSTIGLIHHNLGPEQDKKLDELRNGDDYATLTQLQDEISEREASAKTDPATGESEVELAMPVQEGEWREAYESVHASLIDIGATQARYASETQSAQAQQSVLYATVGSLAVAALAIGGFLLARRSANRLVDRLHRLRDDTQVLTDERLPDLMGRLRSQEPVLVDDEVANLASRQYGDEIGQVARSFDAAHRVAVEAAVRQSDMRQGINRVFLSIAHRSQTLVHRQLRLLDTMERQQEDPEQLTELFKLDHLATRSRRNAENLLILGGETPGRTWHRPMPLIDVLRGAISESGDYSRVDREGIAPVALKGPAVADAIHLAAELLDNATTFSPPHTQVRLRSETVPNGVTVEIEDRGLGMQDEEFETANELLANPPEFDVMRLNEKMRLGLFVVSRLARRHDIKVWLRSSPYGGVQAIVLLPKDLIVTDPPQLPQGVESADTMHSSESPLEGGAPDATTGPPPAAPEPVPTGANGDRPDIEPTGPQTHPADPPPPARTTPSGLPRRDSRQPASPQMDAPAGDNGGPAPAPTGARPPLPKRDPQANLAPQLREEPSPPSPSPTGPTEVGGEERSAKLRRDLSAFQQGTRQGRDAGQRHRVDNDTEKGS